jgi:hypothetical protein
MISLNQHKLLQVLPRGKFGACVPLAIAFLTGRNYYDVEEVIEREQPKYRPDIKSNAGVNTMKFLGDERVLCGHRFVRLPQFDVPSRLADFLVRHPTGSFLIRRNRHVYSVKDGQVFDVQTDSFYQTILEAWKVVPKA